MIDLNIRSRSKSLTDTMKTVLMECHERELLKQEPCDIATHFAHGLLRRGFLEARKFVNSKGKEIMGLFLTEAGRQYLDQL